MNKRAIVAALFLTANLVPPAIACKVPNKVTVLSTTAVQTALEGSTLVSCFPSGGPPWTNQETLSGSRITDYKNGPPAAGNTDPTAVVGSYAFGNDGSASNGVVTYTYGSQSFSFYVALVSGTICTFYGPWRERNQGPCGTYGNVAVKTAAHC